MVQIYLAVGFLFLLLSIFTNIGFNTYVIFFSALLIVAAYVAALIYRKKVMGIVQWIDFFNLFSISFIIVFCQIALLTPFYPELSAVDVWFGGDRACTGMFLSLSGYCFFCSGYLCAMRRYYSPRQILNNVVIKRSTLEFIIYICSFIALTLNFVFIHVAGDRFWSGAIESSSLYSYIYVIRNVFILSAVSLEFYRLRNVISNKNILTFILNFNKILALSVVFITFTHLYSGDRGFVVVLFSALGCGYGLYFRHISALPFFAMLVFCVLMLAFVMRYRGYSDYGNTASLRFSDSSYIMSQSRWYDFTGELAYSVSTLNIALNACPKSIPYQMGRLRLAELISIVPFFNRYLFVSKGSPLLITEYIMGPYPRYGLGSSLIGDLYIDMSYYGVLLLLPFGFMISYIEFKSIARNSLYLFTLYLNFCGWGAVYMNRSSLFTNIQSLVWSVLFVIVINVLFGIVQNRGNA